LQYCYCSEIISKVNQELLHEKRAGISRPKELITIGMKIRLSSDSGKIREIPYTPSEPE
jgi:hypothetical protein